MTLTGWYPCTIAPVREGWYEVQRKLGGRDLGDAERMRFRDGQWDWLSCESELAVWVSHDYWRGVTEESK